MEVDYSRIGFDDYGSIVIPQSSNTGEVGSALNGIATAFLQRASDAISSAIAPRPVTQPAQNGTVPQVSNVQRLVMIAALVGGAFLLYKAIAK